MANLTTIENEFTELDLTQYLDLEGLNEEQITAITEYALELAENGKNIDQVISILEKMLKALKKSMALYNKGMELAEKLAWDAFLAQ
jgi:exonuclease VII small subunit